jgi:hypothetical protein
MKNNLIKFKRRINNGISNSLSSNFSNNQTRTFSENDIQDIYTENQKLKMILLWIEKPREAAKLELIAKGIVPTLDLIRMYVNAKLFNRGTK